MHIQEIHWLRAIACLSVVGLHAITSGITLFYPEDLDTTGYLLHIIQMSLMFGTPTFIFISEFLFAKNYSNHIPKGFLAKRVKALGLPYIAMAVVYAVFSADDLHPKTLLIKTLTNIFLGDFVAYFILIIFQFYIAHILLYEKLQRVNPKTALIIAFLINASYLSIFNFISPPDNEIMEYIWAKGHWLLFIGWSFYFVLGFYCGRYYDKLLDILHHYKKHLPLFALLFLVIVLVLKYLKLPSYTSSKRIDIIFYTTSVIFLVLSYASKIKVTPKLVFIISKYSFSIYLLHTLFVYNIKPMGSSLILHIFIVFVLGVILPIGFSFVFNLLPFGRYLVGSIGKTPDTSALTDKRTAIATK